MSAPCCRTSARTPGFRRLLAAFVRKAARQRSVISIKHFEGFAREKSRMPDGGMKPTLMGMRGHRKYRRPPEADIICLSHSREAATRHQPEGRKRERRRQRPTCARAGVTAAASRCEVHGASEARMSCGDRAIRRYRAVA